MINVTRYQVYPTREQADTIFRQFNLCTDLRNKCLDTGNFDVRQLPTFKKEQPELKEVHSVVLQNMLFQIKDNIKALSKLKKNSHRVGRLRHKPVRTLVYEQTGFKFVGNRLNLSKIGNIRIVVSRSIPGVIKQVVLKFTKTHRWFVSVISRTTDEPIKCEQTRTVGIDMNLIVFSHDSDNNTEQHPHNVRKALVQLGRAQRKMSRKVKGSHNRRKQRLVVARIHETVQNRRDDFLHKWSTKYVFQSNYSGIAVEKLNIKGMIESNMEKMQNKKMRRAKNRNTFDAAWFKARTFLQYKAERAGIDFKVVDPAYTSQTCSGCGHRQKMDESVRTYVCPVCGMTMNRDLNAAINIERRAFGVGRVTPEFKLVEISTSIPSSSPEQVLTNEARIPCL
jgi:putative transposase